MSSVTKSVFEDSKTPKEQGTNNQKKKNGENTVKGGKAVLKEAISVVDDYVANCGYQLLHAAHKNLSKQAPDPKEYQKFLQNRERNRSERIPCLDKTRFVLEPKENEKDSSDYIHASRIVIEGVDKEFIITQAPLRNTLEDFWRMVFQRGYQQPCDRHIWTPPVTEFSMDCSGCCGALTSLREPKSPQ